MISRTPYLSGLVLLSSAFPGQLFRVGAALAVRSRPGGTGLYPALGQLAVPVALLATAALVWYVAPGSGVGQVPAHWYWLAVAVAAGVAAPAWEVSLGTAAAWLRRQRVGRIRLHEQWSGAGAVAAAGAAMVAAAEEVIFRGVGVYLLAGPLGWPAALAVAVAALVYGLNHLYFGWLTVAQKCVTGLVLGWLFVAAGYSVLVPVLAHVVQNLAVLLLLPRLGVRAGDR